MHSDSGSLNVWNLHLLFWQPGSFSGGTHLLFSATPLRTSIANLTGPRGFTIAFSTLTVVSMSGLIWAVAVYGDAGRPGLNLAAHEPARWGLGAVAGLGALLVAAGLINYPGAAIANLARRQSQNSTDRRDVLNPINSIEKLTRHPFFVGLALMMSAHALLATTLASAIYFAGFVILSLVGIPLLDRKLRFRWGKIYEDYEAQTPAIPLTGVRIQQDVPTKSAWKKWVAAIIVTIVLIGLGHPFWTYANGVLFAVFILLFGLAGVAKGLATTPAPDYVE